MSRSLLGKLFVGVYFVRQYSFPSIHLARGVSFSPPPAKGHKLRDTVTPQRFISLGLRQFPLARLSSFFNNPLPPSLSGSLFLFLLFRFLGDLSTGTQILLTYVHTFMTLTCDSSRRRGELSCLFYSPPFHPNLPFTSLLLSIYNFLPISSFSPSSPSPLLF